MFNQPVGFDTSSVTAMEGMFYRAAAFNQPLSFDTSSVFDMYYMFGVCSARALGPSLQLGLPSACVPRASPPPTLSPASRPKTRIVCIPSDSAVGGGV